MTPQSKNGIYAVPLSKLDTDMLLEQLRVARAKRINDDPFARRTWELRVVELQRELAVRNARATAALGETTGRLGERHTDLLEKFVDQYHEAYPDFCEAIEAALAALESPIPSGLSPQGVADVVNALADLESGARGHRPYDETVHAMLERILKVPAC